LRFDQVWFEALAPKLAADALYARVSGQLDVRLLFETEGRAAVVRLAAGRIVEVQAPPPLMTAWDFALRGDGSAWDDLLAPVPPPRGQSIFALARAGRLRLDGNWLVLMQNLWAVTCLIGLMRAHDAGAVRGDL
jgi:hypothetical protein